MVASKITTNALKSYFIRQDVLGLLLGISQQSANYLLAQQLFGFLVLKPATGIVELLKTYFLDGISKPGDTHFNIGKQTFNLIELISQLASFAVCSAIVFVMSVLTKTGLKKDIIYTYDVKPSGYFPVDAANGYTPGFIPNAGGQPFFGKK